MTNRDVALLKVAALVVPVTLGLSCVERDWSLCSPQDQCKPGFVCTATWQCVRATDAGTADGGDVSADVASRGDGMAGLDSGGDRSTNVDNGDAAAQADAPVDAPADATAHDTAPDLPMVDAPGTCSTDKDCSPSAPLCLGNHCAKCSSDNDCQARSGTPACAGSGLCVACTQNKHCAGSPDAGVDAGPVDAADGGTDGGDVGGATASLCDTTTNQCVECLQRSDCAGACQACAAGVCVAVTNQDDPAGCAGTCDSQSVCRSKQGQLCQTTANGCLAGMFCSPDAYCCDTACTSPCMACDVQGHVGACTPVTSGAPHSGHLGCGTDPQCMGTCTGQADGHCTYPVAKTCGGGPICSGPSLIGTGTCSQGSCVAPAGQLCNDGFNCSGTACKTSCAAAADCQDSYTCLGGSCHVKALGVAIGTFSACAVFFDGKVRCWGGDSAGELGDGQVRSPGQSILVPTAVIGISNAKSIAAGFQHYCALLGDGTVHCWGANTSGQLGNGGYDNASTPTAVTGLVGAAVTAIAAGGNHTCALLSDSTVRCWGADESGQLGVLGGNPSTPQAPNLSGVKAIAAGGYHTCVLTSDGEVRCWGLNGDGELGIAITDEFTIVPQTVAGLPGAASAIAAGTFHSCALLTDGTVYCWGLGTDGQLGTGLTDSSATPALIYVAPATAISASGISTCALLATKTVSCWGRVMNPNDYEYAASGSCLSPAVVPGTANVIAVAAGDRSCAVVQDGSIVCWGSGLNASAGTFDAGAVAVPGW
ncbi:MAG: hypothetical protein ABSF35_05905 [Polyangia bacterium]|jgi:alpha-tubulin suppressor-like RCC1 family protein